VENQRGRATGTTVTAATFRDYFRLKGAVVVVGSLEVAVAVSATLEALVDNADPVMADNVDPALVEERSASGIRPR